MTLGNDGWYDGVGINGYAQTAWICRVCRSQFRKYDNEQRYTIDLTTEEQDVYTRAGRAVPQIPGKAVELLAEARNRWRG